jgi:hypothetical protein
MSRGSFPACNPEAICRVIQTVGTTVHGGVEDDIIIDAAGLRITVVSFTTQD